MEVPHTTIVKERVGKEAIAALEALFVAATGTPPAVPVVRFRADHPEWFDVLDILCSAHQLIERSHDGKSYLIRSYALPLIDQAAPLLDTMQAIYSQLRERYSEVLDEKQEAADLIAGIDRAENDLMEALYFLGKTDGAWSCKSNDFPYGEEKYLCINESVLRIDSIGVVLSQYYERHFIKPKTPAPTWSPSDFLNNRATNFFAAEPEQNFPAWYEKLDAPMRELIAEINTAINNKLRTLPTIGLRTLLDMVIVEHIGDSGTFKQKLERFENEGHISSTQSELLLRVLDTGSAAAHRGHTPDQEDLQTCIDFVKSLMHSLYILHPNIQRLHQNTPSRGSNKR